jgi:hypothetical protein
VSKGEFLTANFSHEHGVVTVRFELTIDLPSISQER